MKSILLFDNFYQDLESLHELVSTLDFKESFYGEEIVDFNFIPPDSQENFCQIMAEDLEVSDNSGLFRKSYSTIHFENFNGYSRYVAILAIEPTTIKFYRHEKGFKSVIELDSPVDEFVPEFFDESKWDCYSSITLEQNQIIFLRPWMFHSLSDSLVQVFYLNTKISEEGDNNGRF